MSSPLPLDLPPFVRIGPLDWSVVWDHDAGRTDPGCIDYQAQTITLPANDTTQRAAQRMLEYIVAALVDVIDADPADYYGTQVYTAHVAAGVHSALRDAPGLLRAMLPPGPVADAPAMSDEADIRSRMQQEQAWRMAMAEPVAWVEPDVAP